MTTHQLMWACASYKDKDGKYLLEGVRETCTGLDGEVTYSCLIDTAHPYPGVMVAMHRPGCKCHGLGWTPTEDAWKWLSAVWLLCNKYFNQLWLSTIGLLALESKDIFFSFLEASLRPLAANASAAEAEAWVREKIHA